MEKPVGLSIRFLTSFAERGAKISSFNLGAWGGMIGSLFVQTMSSASQFNAPSEQY